MASKVWYPSKIPLVNGLVIGAVSKSNGNENIVIPITNIKIYTDAPSRLNGGSFGKLAANIPNASITTQPIIDLICTEQGVLNFAYDIVK